MSPFDENGRPTRHTDEIEIALAAAKNALKQTIDPASIDGLTLVSCTATEGREHLSRLAFDLHRELGLSEECTVRFNDLGCGGFVHTLIDGVHMLQGSPARRMLIVASNAPSVHFANRLSSYKKGEAWLSAYLFGDGAAAVVIEKVSSENAASVLAYYRGVNSSMPLMEYGHRNGSEEPVYYIDAKSVKETYAAYLRRAIAGLSERYTFKFSDIARCYFHQANGKLVDELASSLGLGTERVAKCADIYGNTSAAATPIMFAEDMSAGRIGRGDTVLFCAIGAGMQYGATLVKL